MTPPYDPDFEDRDQGIPGARPEDRQWWASRATSEPLEPGNDRQDPRLEERSFDEMRIDGAPYGQDPYGQDPYGQASTSQGSWAQASTSADPWSEEATSADLYAQAYGQEPASRNPWSQEPTSADPFGAVPYAQATANQNPLGQAPVSQAQVAQPPTDTTYQAWAPSASGWAPIGGLQAGARARRYVPNSGFSAARDLLDWSLMDLPRPLSDPVTGRSAAYLLALSVTVGIFAALVVLLAFLIAFATLLPGGG